MLRRTIVPTSRLPVRCWATRALLSCRLLPVYRRRSRMQKCPFIPSELDEVPYPERSQGPGACARSRLVDSEEVQRMLLRCPGPSTKAHEPLGWFGQRSYRFGRRLDRFGRRSNSFGRRSDSFGRRPDSFGRRFDSFGRMSDSFGRRVGWFGRRSGSFGWRSDGFGLRSDRTARSSAGRHDQFRACRQRRRPPGPRRRRSAP